MVKLALTTGGLVFVSAPKPRQDMEIQEIRARVPEEDLALTDAELRAKYPDAAALSLRRARRLIIDQTGQQHLLK